MCGIYGFYTPSFSDQTLNWFKEIENIMNHRGPDNKGSWLNHTKNIGLGFNRLAIMDLSENSNQPYTNQNLGLSLVFNGEIYNFKNLREELIKKGFKFNTEGEAEVLLYGYKQWGIELVNKIEGMFAIVIYDIKKEKLILIRDIAGQKPLFYFYKDNNLFFSSELKVIIENSIVKKRLDFNSLADYLKFGNSLSPYTLIDNIFQLQAGHYLILNLKNKEFQIKNYFELRKQEFKNFSFQEKIDIFDNLFEESITQCLQSDVNKCIMLSGGLDSSLVVSKASKIEKKINTFTVKFSNSKKLDESFYAKKISNYYSTNHTEVDINDFDINDLKNLAFISDNPIADSSLIPTFLISNKISKSFKVAVGGDGSDELFGGYPLYQKIHILNYLKKFKPFKIFKNFQNIFYENYRIKKILFFLLNDTSEELLLTKYFTDLKDLIIQKKNNNIRKSIDKTELENDIVQKLSYLDFKYYLQNNILTKTDRSSMHNSLELRSPFLSKKIINFAMNSLDGKDKSNIIDKKIFLKKYAKTVLPKEFNFNRKQGFVLPVNDLMFDVKFNDYIKEIYFDDNKLFHKEILSKLYKYGKSGNLTCSNLIYSIFILNQWIRRYNVSI